MIQTRNKLNKALIVDSVVKKITILSPPTCLKNQTVAIPYKSLTIVLTPDKCICYDFVYT